jgi:hypothetical protein
MAEAKKKLFNLKSEEGVDEILEHVVNGIADNAITRNQADPINTAVKQKLNLIRLKQRYLEMFVDIHREKIRTGEMGVDDVAKKLPHFFQEIE